MASKAEIQFVDIMRTCANYRKQQEITQLEVADSLNLYQQDISKMERCKHIPTMVKFLEYLDSIGLTIVLKKI